jgi:hypothetical protein
MWSQIQAEVNQYDIFAIPGHYQFGYSYYMAIAGWFAAASAGCMLLVLARRRPTAALARGEYAQVPGI